MASFQLKNAGLFFENGGDPVQIAAKEQVTMLANSGTDNTITAKLTIPVIVVEDVVL